MPTSEPIRLPLGPTETIPWPSTDVPEGTGIKATPLTPAKFHVGFKGQVSIFQNLPFSLPRMPAFFVTKVSGNAMLTENTIYDLHNVDQYDWNKLTGISFNILRPDQNALMVAWRYNVTRQQFEIAPYYNVDLAGSCRQIRRSFRFQWAKPSRSQSITAVSRCPTVGARCSNRSRAACTPTS